MVFDLGDWKRNWVRFEHGEGNFLFNVNWNRLMDDNRYVLLDWNESVLDDGNVHGHVDCDGMRHSDQQLLMHWDGYRMCYGNVQSLVYGHWNVPDFVLFGFLVSANGR